MISIPAVRSRLVRTTSLSDLSAWVKPGFSDSPGDSREMTGGRSLHALTRKTTELKPSQGNKKTVEGCANNLRGATGPPEGVRHIDDAKNWRYHTKPLDLDERGERDIPRPKDRFAASGLLDGRIIGRTKGWHGG